MSDKGKGTSNALKGEAAPFVLPTPPKFSTQKEKSRYWANFYNQPFESDSDEDDEVLAETPKMLSPAPPRPISPSKVVGSGPQSFQGTTPLPKDTGLRGTLAKLPGVAKPQQPQPATPMKGANVAGSSNRPRDDGVAKKEPSIEESRSSDATLDARSATESTEAPGLEHVGYLAGLSKRPATPSDNAEEMEPLIKRQRLQ